MKYDWIFFDLDNTLIDFSGASKRAFSACLEHYAIKEEQGLYEAYEVVNHDVWMRFEQGEISALQLRKKRFEDFFYKMGYKEIEGIECNAIYVEHLIKNTCLIEGAMDVLETLQGKIQMAIITNGLKEAQRPRLKKLGLTPYFSSVIVSDEIGISKPSIDYFSYALEQCNAPKKEKVLIVGDSLNSDIQGGLNAGIDTCWYNPKKEKNNTSYIANFEINILGDILDIVA